MLEAAAVAAETNGPITDGVEHGPEYSLAARRLCGSCGKPVHLASRHRVREKAVRAQLVKCCVDQREAIRAVERHGDGLWHAIQIVRQQPRPGTFRAPAARRCRPPAKATTVPSCNH